MDKFVIKGGNALNGEVIIPSAKNSYLPILAATILCEEKIILHNCPYYSDIKNMCALLEHLGAKVKRFGSDLIIDSSKITSYKIPAYLSGCIRSSIFSLGSILGRCKKAVVAYPGGCEIGARPIDLHIKGLRALKVKIKDRHGYLNCDGRNLTGGTITLDMPSVGATENIMLAGVLAKGETKIINSAKEPEIVDLQNFLNSMGAKVSGAGTSVITIKGVSSLHSTEYTPIPDRIITGTILLSTIMTGGKVTIKNSKPEHIQALLSKLDNNSCKVSIENDRIIVESDKRPLSIHKIETAPFPGFATDLQPQVMSLQTISKGTSIIVENLFETRFKHVPQLHKMGADIVVKDRTAIINGATQLFGAEVTATDLRGGAALVMAGLVAKGTTVVHNVKYIDRGYENFEKMLSSLGAEITRDEEKDKGYFMG